METYVRVATIVILLLLLPEIMSARHISRPHSHDAHDDHSTVRSQINDMGMKVKPDGLERDRKAWKKRDTLKVAGSTLPDCSHACGSCSPCRLIIVGFVCATIKEAESCPMAYKCMCHNKSYPVP